MTASRDGPDSPQPGAELEAALAVPQPLRTMLRRAAHAMVVVRPDGCVVECNPRAEALLDRPGDDLAGTRIATLVHEADRRPLLARIQDAAHGEPAPADLEVALASRPGGRGLICVSFLPFDGPLVALLLRDLTEEGAQRAEATRLAREELAAETVEHRKMADLGRLISGVAHELRTPLTFITNTLELERTRLEEIVRARRELEPLFVDILRHHRDLEAGTARISRLVRDLRPLTKNRPYRNTPMDLAQLVVEAVGTFRGAHGSDVRVELDLQATHLLPIDREDMHNVVVNLLNNAAEAMEGKGVVRIVTRNVSTPPEIRVIDHGPGVAHAIREHLFQPFRTTKRDGTGLGLFISRRTVEAHGGTLTYEDTPGGGATFIVRLPMPA